MRHLSIVMTGRDDDHCIGFARRMQNSIDMYGYFADLFQFDIEIVVVEWNPLGHKTLWNTLVNPSSRLMIRVIMVPKQIHDQVEHTKFDAPGANEMSFFLGIAQNVGIRRAKGKFILATNADIIPNRLLMQFLSRPDVLAPDIFYRIYRHDMDRVVPQMLGPDQSILIYEREAKLRGRKVTKDMIHKKAAGDFILAHLDVFNSVRGFPEIRCDGLKIDGEILDNMSRSANQSIFELPFKIFHQYHPSRYVKTYNRDTDVRLFGQVQRSFKWHDDRTRICTDSMPMNWNRESWGLANCDLKEKTL